MTIDSLTATQLFDDLIQFVRTYPYVGNAQLDIYNVATEDIWTYESAKGRRIVIPWHTVGLPFGQAQMDIVFGEELFAPPVETQILLSDEENVTLWTASKEFISGLENSLDRKGRVSAGERPL